MSEVPAAKDAVDGKWRVVCPIDDWLLAMLDAEPPKEE
jgi:hypothetical protein